MTFDQLRFTLKNNPSHDLDHAQGGGLECKACKAKISKESMEEGPVYLARCAGKRREKR